jgi:hypothetical protein
VQKVGEFCCGEAVSYSTDEVLDHAFTGASSMGPDPTIGHICGEVFRHSRPNHLLRTIPPLGFEQQALSLEFQLGAQWERSADQGPQSARTGLSCQRAGEPLDPGWVRTALLHLRCHATNLAESYTFVHYIFGHFEKGPMRSPGQFIWSCGLIPGTSARRFPSGPPFAYRFSSPRLRCPLQTS